MDLTASAVGLLVLSPLLAAIAVAIKLDSRGPVLFRQERVGLRGSSFRMWKFRTMVADAERRGPAITVAGDPRITAVGGLLRRLKLDELPQLWNVVRGEMTMVGPRPEVPRYVVLYSQSQRRVLQLVPGITDPASIEYRHESVLLAAYADPEKGYVQEIMPRKIELNLDYDGHASARSDLTLILRTLVHLGR